MKIRIQKSKEEGSGGNACDAFFCVHEAGDKDSMRRDELLHIFFPPSIKPTIFLVPYTENHEKEGFDERGSEGAKIRGN